MTASRTSRRPAGARQGRIVAIALAAGLGATVALTGCSAGQITQTATQVSPIQGVNAQAGDVALRDLVIAYDGPEGYPAGGDAPLVVRLFNNGAASVTLTGVTAEKAASVTLVGTPEVVTSTQPPPPAPATTETVAPTGSPEATVTAPPTTQAPGVPVSITIPPQSYVLLVPGQGQSGFLRLNGLTEAIAPGESTTVTFTFSDGARATVAVPLAPPVGTVPRATPVVAPEHAQAEHS